VSLRVRRAHPPVEFRAPKEQGKSLEVEWSALWLAARGTAWALQVAWEGKKR
jgi:hypothetical protein